MSEAKQDPENYGDTRISALPMISTEFFEKLRGTGLVPPLVKRFVIDSGEPGEAVKVYWECLGDKAFLDVVVEEFKVRVKTQETPE